MKKVLLVGPDFYGYIITYCNCLRQNGFCVKVIESNMDVYSRSLFIRGYCRLNKNNVSKYLTRVKIKMDKIINKEYDLFKPDYVLMLNGDMLYPETAKKMRKHSLVSLVTTDAFENTNGGLETAKEVNFCYAFEGTDVKKYQAEVPSMQFMPIGYDDEIYHPIECKKDIDISFVGNGDKKRLFILKSLIRDFPELNMKFYGIGVSHVFFWKYIAFKLSKDSKYIIPHGLKPQEINLLYARSKICLNINKDQSIEGWNPRTNEILGTNSFQLAMFNPGTRNEFSNCLDTYDSYDELKRKIVYYLAHPDLRESMAHMGYELVSSKHTFRTRVERIITDWENDEGKTN